MKLWIFTSMLALLFSANTMAQDGDSAEMNLTRAVADQVFSTGATLMRVLELEAATEGQDESLYKCLDESCLPAVAKAVDADAIVFGQLRQSGEALQLIVMTYDPALQSRTSRTVFGGTTLVEIRSQIDKEIKGLVPFPDNKDEFRVLVMDVARIEGEPYVGRSPIGSTFDPTWSYVGLGIGGAGLAALALGGGLGIYAFTQNQKATADETFQNEIPDLVKTRDTTSFIANILFIAGGTATLIGGTILAVSFGQGIE